MWDAALFVAAIAALAAVGIGFLVLVRIPTEHALLAAPAIGACLLPPAVIILYSSFKQPLDHAILEAWLVLALLSLAAVVIVRPKLAWRHISVQVVSAGLIAVFIFWSVNHATLWSGGPAVLLMDGSDQLGYSHFADWLRLGHVTDVSPRLSPDAPYDSWAHYAAREGRLGTYLFPAMTAFLSNRPALFSLDLTFSVMLTSGIIGAAALLTKRRLTFVLLAFGLSCSLWFALSRSGYLAKVVTYPTILYFVGLAN
jgi:hypothetical protein